MIKKYKNNIKETKTDINQIKSWKRLSIMNDYVQSMRKCLSTITQICFQSFEGSHLYQPLREQDLNGLFQDREEAAMMNSNPSLQQRQNMLHLLRNNPN